MSVIVDHLMRIGSFLKRTKSTSKALQEGVEDLNHPERLALLPYCTEGRGIDVGCGHRKTHDNCIGIDIVPAGEEGHHGCARGKKSSADICASGDNLLMFADGEMDFVISRHNLEHYVDVIKTLLEWKRVLRVGGILGVVLPDDRYLDSIALDPTHKHAFTPESFEKYLSLIGGFSIRELSPVIFHWSFLCVATKIHD